MNNIKFESGEYTYQGAIESEFIKYSLEEPDKGKGLLLMFYDGRYDINVRLNRGSKKRGCMYRLHNIEELKQLLKDAETRLYKVIIED